MNDPLELNPLDSIGMAAATEALPAQLEDALAAAQSVEVDIDGSAVSNIVVMGMGGSGIAGDIVSALAAPAARVPVIVVKGYECPSFVGPGTLAIAVSFSGNTEETVEAATAAHDAGAAMVAVTSGGQIAELAAGWGAPLYRVDSAIPMPRCAVGAITVAPLVALERVGLLSGARASVSAAVAQLRARQNQVHSGTDADPLSAIADVIEALGRGEQVPVFYGGGAVGAVAAGRAKAQVNENAKLPAYSSVMPELCHNELAGWVLHESQGSHRSGSPLLVFGLRHDFEHSQTRRRYDYTRSTLAGADVAVPYHELGAAGDGPMAQMFDLIYQVDVLSLRMTAAAGRDPGPVDVLIGLKEYLVA